MERIPQSPPPISPLVSQADRPLFSVMIPVYNCSGYLQQVLDCVLIQDLGPDQMQIEVVDDASTDTDVEALVKELGRGRVSYFRQRQNVGSLRNFETCINRARGHLVHLLHGDDRVLPGFYAKMTELLTRFPDAGAAFCNYYHLFEGEDYEPLPQNKEMDEDGILNDWLYKIAKNQRLQYVSVVVRRSVYEQLGSFYGVTYGEDWEMWVRIARYYSVAYTPEVLAEYRVHAESISTNKIKTGQAFRDLRYVMNAIQNHLAEDKRKQTLAESKKIWAEYGVWVAYDVWNRSRSLERVNTQVWQVLRLHIDPQICWGISKLYLKMALQTLKLREG